VARKIVAGQAKSRSLTTAKRHRDRQLKMTAGQQTNRSQMTKPAVTKKKYKNSTQHQRAKMQPKKKERKHGPMID